MESLALYGGNPVVSCQIDRPSPFGRRELVVASEVIRSGVLSKAGRGAAVVAFEGSFATFHGVRYAVSTNSGTAALHTAVVALGIKGGDEVLVPALTFVSSASAVLQERDVLHGSP